MKQQQQGRFEKKKKKALSNNLFLVAHTQNGRRAVKAMRN